MSLDLTEDKSTLVQVMVGVVRQQAITWANDDSVPCRLMATLGHNELTLKHLGIVSFSKYNLNFWKCPLHMQYFCVCGTGSI